jgi:ubiquinone/menaquinone biosynthesis C-methylase UbiE
MLENSGNQKPKLVPEKTITPKKLNIENWDNVAPEYASFVHDRYIHFPELAKLVGENFRDKTIVDIGSGIGLSSQIIKQSGAKKVIGIEISEKMVEIAKNKNGEKGIEFVVGDARKLPFTNESVDGAVMATLLSNFNSKDDIKKVISEVCRVIKVGGKLIITIPHPRFENESYPGARIRTFTEPYDYKNEGQKYSLELVREDGRPVKVFNYHWTMETYLQIITDADFDIKQLVEPKPIKSDKSMDKEEKMLVYLMIIAEKK